ncbi:unnamed protein product [Tuber aestivum]|uniref:GPI anchored serine-rich protein n=1 Tax=Tuber aestivum TaxID=59557 RepID=A0A292Q2H8_9PEZI|nr:unnamed protein product [Tuber aestivum]
MRFSTIAVSAALFGATAMALPGSVVYQTEVVTITSCAPEKTNCPGKPTSSPVVSSPPVVTPVCPGAPHCPPTYPVPSSGYSTPISPNGTYVQPAPSSKPVCPGAPHCPPAPVCPGGPNCPYPTTTSKPIAIPGTGLPYVPSGTGVPTYPSKNTSVPVAPTTPPTYTGSASIQSFSVLAVGVAVAALFL